MLAHCSQQSVSSVQNSMIFSPPHIFGGDRWMLRLTISNPLPPSILSVVAATLPPFRCRSHITCRLSSWGNMAEIWSTWAMLARDWAVLLDREVGLLAEPLELLEKYHRAPRRRRIVRTMIWGKFIVASVEGEDIVRGVGWSMCSSGAGVCIDGVSLYCSLQVLLPC